MTQQVSIHRYRTALMAFVALCGTGIAGSASAIDWGPEAYREDRRTCEHFGADQGRDFTTCMIQQQRRRDDALLDASRQQRNNAEAARINVETVRRMRCNREAERARERGERPRWC